MRIIAILAYLIPAILNPIPILSQSIYMYVGTSGQRDSKGIYVYEFDQQTAETRLVQTLDHLKGPTFLALHPSGDLLYSANRQGLIGGQKWGSISAFSIQKENAHLTPLNDVSSLAAGACHVQTDHSGRLVFVANYAGGSMSAYALEPDGRIGKLAGDFSHQKAHGPVAHAHASIPAPNNRLVFVPDLGNDELIAYRIKPQKGKVRRAARSTLTLKKGVGPRHFIFHPNGRLAFVAEELGSSVSSLAFRSRSGRLSFIERESTLPAAYTQANKVADIHIHPNGRWLYVSNRGHDSLAIFEVDPGSGALKPLGHRSVIGSWPRGFAISPNGRFLLVANRKSDHIIIFKINADNGQLEDSGQRIELPAPMCIKFRN